MVWGVLVLIAWVTSVKAQLMLKGTTYAAIQARQSLLISVEQCTATFCMCYNCVAL